MILRLKIYFTIVALYEIAAIMLLHCAQTCDAMFGATFCDDHAFKYFVWCVAVPVLVALVFMWVHQIMRHRRRHMLVDQVKTVTKDMYQNVRTRVLDQVSPQDVAGLISAAILMGVKKLSDRAAALRAGTRGVSRAAAPVKKPAARPTTPKRKK